MIKVLSFIREMSDHVKGTEEYSVHKDKLSRLYASVHETTAWSENAQIIFDMGNLLFEADLALIDEFHTGNE